MIPMTMKNARDIVEELLESRKAYVRSIDQRVKQLKLEYEEDQWEDTAAQIKRLETRLVHYRLEVEALTIVLAE